MTVGLKFHNDDLKSWLLRIISHSGTSQRVLTRDYEETHLRYGEFSIQVSHYVELRTSRRGLLDGRGVLLFRKSPRSQKENSLYKVRWFCAVGGGSHFKSGLNCVCLHCATVRLKGVNMGH